MKITKKEVPTQLQGAQPQSSGEKVVEKVKDLKAVPPAVNMYPAEMVENAKRALKYAKIKGIETKASQIAWGISNDCELGFEHINKMATVQEDKSAYSKSDLALIFDLYGGEAGKKWAIEQLKRK